MYCETATCLFVYLTGLHYLPCALCHFIHFYIIIFYFNFFLHVLICNSCIFVYVYVYIYVCVYIYIFDLYLSVFLRSTVSV